MDSLSDLDELKDEMKASTDASVDAVNKCQADKVMLTKLCKVHCKVHGTPLHCYTLLHCYTFLCARSMHSNESRGISCVRQAGYCCVHHHCSLKHTTDHCYYECNVTYCVAACSVSTLLLSKSG
jgi:hypothetical protein